MARWSENQVQIACFSAAARLVADARVLLVCNGESGAGEHVLESGAQFVHVFDPHSPTPVPTATRRGLVVSRLPEGDIEAREGAFDVAIVCVGPDSVTHRGAGRVLHSLRRAVKSDGIVCVLLSGEMPATDPPYLGLYDELGNQFPFVAVYGVFPWMGVAMAELGEAETDDISIEGAGGAPRLCAYMMIAGASEQAIPSYSLVEIPEGEDEEALADPAEFAEVKLQAALLAAQLEEQRARSTRDVANESVLARRLEENEKFLRAEKERADRLVENTRKLDELIAEATREARRATDDLDVEHRARKKLELENQLLKEQVETLSAWKPPQVHVLTPSRTDDIETTVALRGDDLAKLAGHTSGATPPSQAEDVRVRLEQAEARAMELGRAFEAERDRVSRYEKELEKHSEIHGEEIRELESKLEERAKRFGELHRELLDKTRIAEDLIGRLAEVETSTAGGSAAVESPAGPSVHEGALRAMSLDLAKYEGELRAREWRIQELEATLRLHEAPRDQEILELKQALAREHEARRKAEAQLSK